MHGLTKEQLAARQVETLDIASDSRDYWSYIIGASNFDFSQFQSARTGRGPLLDRWQVGVSSSFIWNKPKLWVSFFSIFIYLE